MFFHSCRRKATTVDPTDRAVLDRLMCRFNYNFEEIVTHILEVAEYASGKCRLCPFNRMPYCDPGVGCASAVAKYIRTEVGNDV